MRRRARPHLGIAVRGLVALIAMLPAVARADLTGRWRIVGAPTAGTTYVDVVQNGTSVVFPDAFMGTADLSGTFVDGRVWVQDSPTNWVVATLAMVSADGGAGSGEVDVDQQRRQVQGQGRR